MAAAVTTHVSLLARLRDDADQAAWREFHERYADLIRGFASRQGLQPADCDDIVQDVLVKLSAALPEFRYDPGRGKFRSYLKTVAVRAIATRFSQKRGQTPVSINGNERPAEPGDNADDTWEVEWRRYHVRRAMRSLTLEFNRADVRAFEQYGIEGRPVHQVAVALDLSPAQVYQAKSVLLRRLCELVEQQVQEEG